VFCLLCHDEDDDDDDDGGGGDDIHKERMNEGS